MNHESTPETEELLARLYDCLDRLDALGEHQAAAAVETAILNLGGSPRIPLAWLEVAGGA